MPILEIKSFAILESNIEEGKGNEGLKYEILAKESNVLWMTSGRFLKDVKDLICNHSELARLKVTSIHVHAPHFHIESTDLPKQILDLTLSGRAEVYHDVSETENG